MEYRSDTVNSNTVNSKFHLIRILYEVSVNIFSIISGLKCTVNSNFHLIRSKTLPTNDSELTVPNLYTYPNPICIENSVSCHVLLQALQVAEFSINLVQRGENLSFLSRVVASSFNLLCFAMNREINWKKLQLHLTRIDSEN